MQVLFMQLRLHVQCSTSHPPPHRQSLNLPTILHLKQVNLEDNDDENIEIHEKIEVVETDPQNSSKSNEEDEVKLEISY